MKKIIKNGPGILKAIVLEKSYKGEHVSLYDEDKLIAEVELDNVDDGIIELDPVFFKKNLVASYKDGVNVKIIYE